MNDQRHMVHALRLARQGLYTTRENPRVGCVVVKDDEVLGEGAHLVPGGPHAEVHALQRAGKGAQGACLYVTLEPCSHHGRTPPCTEAIVQAGIRRVVAAMTDPNPQVAGKGFERLREAGVEVVQGVMSQQAESLNPGFIKRMTRGLPYVRVKVAMSLDGRTAMASGQSRWISSEQSRVDVHRLRAQSCAILTGIGTVLADDPSLTFRTAGHASLENDIPTDAPQPLRVVCDTGLRLPETARLLSQPGHNLVCTLDRSVAAGRFDTLRTEIVEIPEDNGRLSLRSVLHELANRHINEVLVESGPTLAGSLLSGQLVDELVIYMAPHLMGDSARSLFHLPGILDMQQRIPLEISDLRAIGPDWRIRAVPVYS